MKKILLMFTLVAALSVNAEDKIYLNIGHCDFHVPFTEVSQVNLYDVINKKSYFGAETTLSSMKHLSLTFGGVLDSDLKGIPFIGLHTDLTDKYFSERVSLGVWIGRDYQENRYQGGIKANIELW